MTRDSVTTRGATFAAAGMVDTCIIQRPVAGTTPDPVTGAITDVYVTPPVYAGPCRVQQQRVQAEPRDVGQALVYMVRFQVHVPLSVVGIEPDDHVTITASRDPDLVGRSFTVRDLFHKTFPTSRRVGVVERTS